MAGTTLPDGRVVKVPGVYFTTKIATSSPGPAPAFFVPVILASAYAGRPYNGDSLIQSVETPKGAPVYFRTADAAGNYFGRGSDLHRAFVWAQRHGLPEAYCVSLSALTRASAIADATGTNQATVYSKLFGAIGGWQRIKFTGGVLTVQAVKNYAPLKTNLTNVATRVELLGDTSWISVGKTYYLGDNSTPVAAVVVKTKATEYDATGQPYTVIETVAAFGAAITTALYAYIAEYDVGHEEIHSSIATGQQFIDAINNYAPSLLVAKKHAAFSNATPDAVASLTPLKEIATWVSPTPGTSPAMTSADVTAWVSLMNASGFEDFLLRYKKKPQAYFLATGDAVSHGIMRDYSIAERTRGCAISVTTGVRWGDTVIAAGDDTDPLKRTLTLNSENVSLWGPGLDREPAFLSLAGAVFGRRVSGGPGHNLTNDDLVFSELEHRWNEIANGELSTLLDAGFGTVKLSTGRVPRYRVAEGISTLQNNGVAWNVTSRDTYLLMQRDLADYVNWVQQVDLEEDIVGADGVIASVIANNLRQRAEKFLLLQGYLATYTITSIVKNAAGNGFDVQQQYTLPTTNDFVSLENTILT